MTDYQLYLEIERDETCIRDLGKIIEVEEGAYSKIEYDGCHYEFNYKMI